MSVCIWCTCAHTQWASSIASQMRESPIIRTQRMVLWSIEKGKKSSRGLCRCVTYKGASEVGHRHSRQKDSLSWTAAVCPEVEEVGRAPHSRLLWLSNLSPHKMVLLLYVKSVRWNFSTQKIKHVIFALSFVLICFFDSPQMKHVEERFGTDASKEVLLMCIGITSGVGRLIFGRVADYVQGVNKVYLQVSSGLNGYKNTVNAFVFVHHCHAAPL